VQCFCICFYSYLFYLFVLSILFVFTFINNRKVFNLFYTFLCSYLLLLYLKQNLFFTKFKFFIIFLTLFSLYRMIYTSDFQILNFYFCLKFLYLLGLLKSNLSISVFLILYCIYIPENRLFRTCERNVSKYYIL